ncbi:MAG: hypothetical protein EXR71_05580 [Myxococcales bacterium]|nr:hypothetical protein [Myxococcales bacterium]
MWLLPLLAMFAAVVPSAGAAGFQVKTMRAPLSAVEVERPLIIGKGWFEGSFGYEHKFADGAWSADGEAHQWDGAQWLYTTERLGIRYGITRSSELYWDVPFHYVRLVNPDLGTDTASFGIGEPKFGWKLELFNRAIPTTSLVLDVQYKMPTGQETAGTYVGGPNTVATFPMSTGQADLAVFARAKQQLGPIAIEASVGYIHRFSGVSQFVVEVDQYQFSGRFRPGNEVRAELSPMLQMGPIAIRGDAVYRNWSAASVGTTSGGFFVDEQLDVIGGSDGWSFDAGGGLVINASRGVDILASAMVPIRGEDLTFFPLESISPTRGPTLSTSVELRY